MTGTAQTSAEEFHKVYNLEAVSIPSNRPLVRKDNSDLILKTIEAKYRAVIEEVKRRHLNGQPVLLGTTSITNNELVSILLNRSGVPHEVLNAKNHEREGAIIAQAGKSGAVTVATNMAGRGVDIVLGGNPPDSEKAKQIKDLGGLYVIGTERHEARRIDNQLRGRSGRQGDPGETQFFLSLEDDLMRIFGGEKIKSLMETFKFPDDQPIESQMVSKVVNEAQKKVEGFNFDSRKHLLEYDDIFNKQRMAFYKKRQDLLNTRMDANQNANIHENGDENKEINISEEQKNNLRLSSIGMLDVLWMNHLENMEALRESVGMRAYGQHDPLVEYRRESYTLFRGIIEQFDDWLKAQIIAIAARNEEGSGGEEKTAEKTIINPFISAPVSQDVVSKKVGRNDPCWCGAKKADGTPIKYKKCHGK
jgi:preprotein translocase subunit SecA